LFALPTNDAMAAATFEMIPASAESADPAVDAALEMPFRIVCWFPASPRNELIALPSDDAAPANPAKAD
jgi:hypothetical protein